MGGTLGAPLARDSLHTTFSTLHLNITNFNNMVQMTRSKTASAVPQDSTDSAPPAAQPLANEGLEVNLNKRGHDASITENTPVKKVRSFYIITKSY